MMKLGMRNFLAIVAGLVLSYFLQPTETLNFWVKGFVDVVLQLSRYIIYPLFFFNMAIAVGILKREGRLLKTTLMLVSVLVVSLLVMTILGTLVALVFPLERIPIAFEQKVEMVIPFSMAVFGQIFPTNIFTVFSSNFFLPLAVLAFILGINFAYEREIVEPTYNLFDSLGRIFYRLAGFLVQYSCIPLFFFSLKFFYGLKEWGEFTTFRSIIILVLISILVVGLGFYSLIWALSCGYKKGFTWLSGAVPFPLFAFFSGDRLLAFAFSSVIVHRNQGVKRPFGGFAVPMFALFGQAGTAFVNAIVMIVIIKSYNSLDITFSQILLSILVAFVASLLVATVTAPLATMLGITCLLYGNNLSSGSLILQPILPLLSHIGQLLDALTFVFILKIIANYSHFEQHRKHSSFM